MKRNDRMEEDFLVRKPSTATDGKDLLLHGTLHDLDRDADLMFAMRGFGLNHLIDGALPLFALVMRIRKLDSHPDVPSLFKRISRQIEALGEEQALGGYDASTQSSFRYALCTFIDEAVMSTPWGSDSTWAQRSLLSVYHEETWGGEKFYTGLTRMMREPETNRDLLEVMYVCLCLGFKGRHNLSVHGAAEHQAVIVRLHRILRAVRGEAPDLLSHPLANVASRSYRVRRPIPWWLPWASTAVLMLAAFVTYRYRLGLITDRVIPLLDGLFPV
jgi:type VI secretion system protein ImpK